MTARAESLDVGLLALEARPLGWLRTAPASSKRALAAAALGWMFDGFDIMVFSLVLTAVVADFGISRTQGSALGSLTLAASAAGGWMFGRIADRHGRRIGIVSSVMTYSIFTAACGLAGEVWQLAIFRFILGLGMGGAWTTGAALVSESWPDRHRGKAVGLMQSAWAVGYGGAALVSAIVLPRFGWRAMFFLGALPALAALWVYQAVEEPEIWKESRQSGEARLGSLSLIFTEQYRRITASMIVLSFCTLYAYWAFNFWVPSYLSLPISQNGVGLGGGAVAALLVAMNAGGWCGYVFYGYVSDRFGRRRSFVTYLLVSAVLVVVYGSTKSPAALLALGPVVAFFSTGYFSGFGAIIAELYPTAVRATATGFTFNIGRIGSALAPVLIASLAQTRGFGIAFATASAALVLGAFTWIFIPETKGRALSWRPASAGRFRPPKGGRYIEGTMPIKEGWTGRVYEDFEVGDIYPHPLGRTVLSADNIWFTLLTQNTNPIHFDAAYAAKTEFGKPLVDSTFTLALVTGQSVTDISQNAMANLGWDEVRLPNPVFEGDTIYSRSEVLEKRESKSRPNVGIVSFKTTGFNQDGVVVIEYKRTVMIYKRGHVPETARVRPPALK